ncbi:hypothetical protein [Streptomyces atratus]|uniref:hypothetical protein n=1 Tax=Streptomyces atratus TaxID=1893 RepID=UPI003410EAA6
MRQPLGRRALLLCSGTGRFLHWREEKRLRDEGIDPWRGESDPYADTGFDD